MHKRRQVRNTGSSMVGVNHPRGPSSTIISKYEIDAPRAFTVQMEWQGKLTNNRRQLHIVRFHHGGRPYARPINRPEVTAWMNELALRTREIVNLRRIDYGKSETLLIWIHYYLPNSGIRLGDRDAYLKTIFDGLKLGLAHLGVDDDRFVPLHGAFERVPPEQARFDIFVAPIVTSEMRMLP